MKRAVKILPIFFLLMAATLLLHAQEAFKLILVVDGDTMKVLPRESEERHTHRHSQPESRINVRTQRE